MWLPPTCMARSSYLYLQGRGWPSCNSRNWFPFSSLRTIHRTTVDSLNCLHTRTPSGTVSVKVILRSTVSRPVCSGIRPPYGTRNQFFFLLHWNFLQKFAFLHYKAPSLTRWWVCNIYLLLDLASAVFLMSESDCVGEVQQQIYITDPSSREKSKSKLFYYRWSFGQSVRVWGTTQDQWTIFLWLPWKICSYFCGFLLAALIPWR
jgi:hypothetical protein